MKINKLFAFSFTFLLVACTPGINDEKVTIEKSSKTYNAISSTGNIYEIPPLLSDLKVGDVEYRIVENEPLIPYFSIEQYKNIYLPIYDLDKTSISFTDRGDNIQWSVSVNQKTVFVSVFDFKNNLVSAAGSLSSAFTGGGQDTSTLLAGLKMEQKIYNESSIKQYQTFSLTGYGLNPIRVGGKYYVPLGILDLIMAKFTTISVFFDYKEFFLVGATNYMGLGLTRFREKVGDPELTVLTAARKNAIEIVGKTFTINEKTYNVDAGTYPVMPMYLRKYHRSSLIYAFEYYYGLKYARGYKSMKEYLENDARIDLLLDEDAMVRGLAANEFIGDLNDGHTGLRTQNGPIWGEASKPMTGKLWQERVVLASNLTNQRNAAYKQYDYGHASSQEEKDAINDPTYVPDKYAIRYSDDGKLAFFNFDEFSFESDRTKEDIYKTDTFEYFVRQFKSIKSGVEDVVIDLSTNGGGIIIALMKILALITKDNLSYTGTYDMSTNQAVALYVSVDTNQDGKYDKDDVYGDDYNIYLLTSSYSFSCGNAYPFYAQQENIATVIGNKSGGGECTVGTTMLPSGQFVGHSSNSRMVAWKPVLKANGEVDRYEPIGAEEGASVDQAHSVEYKNYYNFNYLASFVKGLSA